MHPVLVKKRGEGIRVLHNSMERGEIEKYGLNGIDTEQIMTRKEQQEAAGQLERMAAFHVKLIRSLGIAGRVAFHGVGNMHSSYFVLQKVFRECPEIEPILEENGSIFQSLRLTKDIRELEMIREVTQKTCLVIESLLSLAGKHRIDGNILAGDDDAPLTLGDLRKYAYVRMAELGLTSPMCQSSPQGGMQESPIARGMTLLLLKLEKPVILDIFPRCSRTGYMADVTRTFCIGRAPDRVRSMFDLVREALQLAISEVEIGKSVALVDGKVSEFFEARGIPTLHNDSSSREGYVHSLGTESGLNYMSFPG